MNPAQLRAFLERNKVALGAAGAAAVAGLAVLRNRQAKDDTPAQASLPALGSALSSGGAPVSGSAGSYYPVSYVGASGGYDSTSSDVYNAIQPQLEALSRLWDKQASPIPVAAPLAAGLYAPTYNGKYVTAGKNATGSGPGIFEVQSDGSLFHLDLDQWKEAVKRGAAAPTKLAEGWNGQWYTTTGNVTAGSTGATPAKYTLDPMGVVVKVPS